MSRSVRFLVAALGFALLLPSGAAAQGGTVSGVVTDGTNQQPISDAQVAVIGTQRGAATDRNGRFSITGVPAGTYQVRARRIGYTASTQTVTVGAGATATVNFTLGTSATQLDEVVVNAVTGVAERKVEVGTNVGHVNVGEMNKGPILSVSDVLQGRVAGVVLQSAVGTQGGGQRVRIRGANSISLSNEPLIYIDGIAASNSKGGIALGGQDYSRLNDINPEEIENIEVLKGPAASAIYGSAASNGVILISTKRGRSGNPQWRAYVEGGVMTDETAYPLNYNALTQRVAGRTDYYDFEDGSLNTVTSWGDPTRPFEHCPNYRAALAPGATGYCTQDVFISFNPLRDSRTTPFVDGSTSKVGVNVSGGAEALTYFISGDQQREYGVLRPNDLNRISLRTNINAKVGERANAAITAAYVKSDTKRLSGDNSVFSPLIVGFFGPAMYIPGMESDTVSTPGARLASRFGYNFKDQQKVTASQDVDRFVIGANGNYTPLSWLRVNGNAGLDYFGRFDRQTQDPASNIPLSQIYRLGFRDAFRSNNYIWTTNASAAATWTPLSSIVSTSTAGVSFQRSLFEQVECFGVGIPSGTASCSATTSQFAVTETHTDLKTIGFFGRQELAFADKLFLSASLRGDNNSGLVSDVSGLTYYPAVNASWVVSREGFFPQNFLVSQLRLRAGWGQAGQRPGFGQGDTFFGSRVVQSGGVEIPALILTNTGNPNLKVERTTEIEGGFDIGFLDDRINAEFTAFQRKSKDALISRQLAPSAGLTGNVFQNLGSVRNWGTELGLNASVFSAKNVSFDARFTATTLKNKIEDLGEGIAPIVINRGEQAHRQGFPTGAYFALPLKWNDADGNGLLTVAEVTVDSARRLVVRNATTGLMDTLNLAYMGPSLPTNTQSLGGDLTLFQNFTLSALFERRAGHKQLNATESFRCVNTDAAPFWGQCGAVANPEATLEAQAAFIGARFKSATPFGYIEDADFIKFRELSLRAGVPESIGNRVSMLKGASLTLSGRNLKTWTDYTGLDPEINETGGSNFNQAEFNTQPPVRLWTLRFDFKL